MFVYLLVVPHSMWHLSSLTRDGTHAPPHPPHWQQGIFTTEPQGGPSTFIDVNYLKLTWAKKMPLLKKKKNAWQSDSPMTLPNLMVTLKTITSWNGWHLIHKFAIHTLPRLFSVSLRTLFNFIMWLTLKWYPQGIIFLLFYKWQWSRVSARPGVSGDEKGVSIKLVKPQCILYFTKYNHTHDFVLFSLYFY